MVDARRVGKPELITTGRARLVSRVHGLAPNLSLRLLSLVNAVLPGAEGSRTFRPMEGRTLDMPWTRSILTLLTRRAARKNREA